MRTLVLSEDSAHPAELTRDGLLGLADSRCEFDFIENPDGWSPKMMREYPFVIFSKANNTSASDRNPWATEETGLAFVDYVKQRKSILFLHSGTALYKDLPSFRNLMGGVFVGHPPQYPVTVEPSEGHIFTTGSTAFTLKDEHYQMEMNDPDVDLFLNTTSEHGIQLAGWTRTEDDGRVCVLTPGHNLEIWHHPSYQIVLRNCIHWCKAGKE
jgi:type 1 glutamine amidotransferase